MSWNNSQQRGADFEERARANQQRLRSNLSEGMTAMKKPDKFESESYAKPTRYKPQFQLLMSIQRDVTTTQT